jgi:2,4-dienoyl-CoA reductase-like NADH-dependent reductase (Old Yellow Enzyme family)
MPSKKLLDMMVDLSKGKTGLIVPGYVYPIKHGKSIRKQTGMFTKKHADVWKDTIKKIHENGSKVIFQICHGGDRCQESMIGQQPIGCSGLIPGSRPMTEAEICDTIDAFAAAAKNLKNVGADGVQIHCAHGFLLSQFLSPVLNRRNDKWGGIIENRTRIVFETIQAVREITNDSLSISIKINGDDCVKGGMDAQMCCEVISMIPPLDFVEISCGIGPKSYTIRANLNESTIKRNIKNSKEIIERAHQMCDGVPYFEGYNIKAAELAKEYFPELPIACTGGWRHFDKMEEAVKSGKCDIISMSRPFIKQPHLVQALMDGAEKVDCDSCNLCSLHREPGVVCQNWK